MSVLETARHPLIGFIGYPSAKCSYDIWDHNFINFIIPYPTPKRVRTALQIIPEVFVVVCLIAESVEDIVCAAFIVMENTAAEVSVDAQTTVAERVVANILMRVSVDNALTVAFNVWGVVTGCV